MSCRRLSGRQINGFLLAAGACTISIVFLSQYRHASAEEATVLVWPEYGPQHEAIYAEYKDIYGEFPNIITSSSPYKDLAGKSSVGKVDVVTNCANNIATLRESGLIEPADTSRLKNFNELAPRLTDVAEAQSGGEDWWVPLDWESLSIVYRTDIVTPKAESWGLLWDDRYAGKIGMFGNRWAVSIAAIYTDPAGYRQRNVNPGPVAEALRDQATRLQPYIIENADALKSRILSGELVAAPTWNSVFKDLRQMGVAVEFMTPKEGRIVTTCGLSFVTSAPQTDKAYDLVDSMIGVQAGRYILENTGFLPANAASTSGVDGQILADLGTDANFGTLSNDAFEWDPCTEDHDWCEIEQCKQEPACQP